MSLVIVLTMVASSFVVMLANAAPDPRVWTSEEAYAPGQTVMIYGDGWVAFEPVSIELTHPDFVDARNYLVEPDLYGGLVCSNYTAEGVAQWDVPVQVKATQMKNGVEVVATTQFFDPAVTFQGYTLKPHLAWTQGDIKGYNEGDSVPYKVVLDKNSFGSTVTVELGLDMHDLTFDTWGIDYLSQYWLDPPTAPFNTYPNSSAPFFVDPLEGTITSQTRMPNQYDSGGNQLILVWRFTLTFASSAHDATVRFGAHMALSSLPSYYGASYYPGSSLHVRIVSLNPPSNQGNRDVPIALGQVMTPPNMTLEKVCDPELVSRGSTITFTIHFNNTGQADARCVVLEDVLPGSVVEYVNGSAIFWTNEDPTPIPFDPTSQSGSSLTWEIAFWRGTGLDDALPPLEGYIQFDAVVLDTAQPGWYRNWVYLDFTDDHGGLFPTLEAYCDFRIVAEPSVEIVKSGPLYAHVGDTITYIYTVTNTGPNDLVDLDVIDDVAGVVILDDTLLVGQTKTYSLTYTITALDPDPLDNTVTATGTDQYGQTTSDDDDWEVDILHPEVLIDKWADKECAQVGELVWYTIYYENPSSDTTLYDVVITDSLLGSWNIGTLFPGQWNYILVPYFATEVVSDPDGELVNTATIAGHDLLNLWVYDSDSWVIDILHPLISITKEANLVCAQIGEIVTYWINVSNPSTDTDMYAYVYDYMISLSALWTGWLAPGASVSLGPYYVPMPQGYETVTNTAFVNAWDRQDHYAYDEASWTVDIVHPSVIVTKVGDKTCAAEGETVTYTITVTNTGDITLAYGEVSDQQISFFDIFVDLAPGASLVWTVSVEMPVGEEYVNTVFVDAWDLQGHYVSDSDSWTVDIVHPSVSITKVGDKTCASEGEEVIYTITVTNTGDIILTYGEVYDSLVGFWASFTNLLPGASITWTVSKDMPVQEEDFVNYAYVDAWDKQGHYVFDWDYWVVDVVHPQIAITKTSEWTCAAEGELVIYTITVTNVGDIEIASGMVYDYQTSFFDVFFDLLPGESVTFTTSMVMPQGDEFINYAFVDAWDLQGHYVSGVSWWIVDIVHPGVEVVKYSELTCAAEGETVTYTITVTNTGDITLLYGTVYDPDTGFTATFTNLAPGDSISWSTSMVMPVGEEFTNYVYVDAVDLQLHEVSDWDSWTIDIVHPSVDIVKWSELTCAAEGEIVTYYITVTNTGDITLFFGEVYDYDTGLYDVFYFLAPGESLTWTVYMPMPVGEQFTNIAFVDAWDLQGHPVSDWDWWTIDIVHPSVDIVKTSELTCAAEGETVTYTITVTNTGDITLAEGWVWDNDASFFDVFYNLAPGDSLTWTVSIVMPAGEEFTNYAYVWAWDLQGHFVSDWDFWTIDIVHPSVEITKVGDKTCAAEGETVTYTITVTNTGDINLASGFVSDSLLSFFDVFYDLAPGDSISWSVSTEMPVQQEDFVNIAYVDAYDDQGHYVSDWDFWVVDVVHPSVEVVKTSEWLCAHEGEQVWYTITVTNTGDITLGFGEVYDFQTSFFDVFFNLAPGDSISWSVLGVIPTPQEEDYTNYVYVDAWDLQDHYVHDTDWWTIEILHPSIDLEKTGPEWANIGDVITYNVSVTNTGDTPLYDVTVFDSLVGWIGYFPVLAIGETQYIEYTYTVPPGQGTLDNIAWVWGYDKQDVWVYDEDEWSVQKYSKIEGYKFGDVDHNGLFDFGEPGIINWVIQLNGTLVGGGYDNRTMLTDSTGYYEFTQLQAGVYVVSEIMQTGWSATTTMSMTFVAGSGQSFTKDFGNMPHGSISGCKWNDTDLDGIWDPNEQGIPGWTIYIIGTTIGGVDVFEVTTTNATGCYEFDNLEPGVYTVYEQLVDGWYATTATSVLIDVSAFEPFNVTGVNFGNTPTGSITGFKWLDEYMNGYRDGYEPMLPGWTIGLEGWTVDGQHVGPIYTVTGANGYYKFDGLLPGDYTVWEVLPDGWTNITPTHKTFTITPGFNATCGKFGNVENGTIEGWKFLDWDMDGDMDGNEPGIPGWAITLTGWLNDGAWPWSPVGATPVGPITIFTDANGHWIFPNLLPGIYTVTEASPPGWYHTTPDSVTLWLTSGLDIYDVKFGNVPYTCITGKKFEDKNGNGIMDQGEPGVPGWHIWINGTQNDGLQISIELVTNETGDYKTCFVILPGTYTISEVMQPGWFATTPQSYEVTLQQTTEPTVLTYNFGNFKLGKITGCKYEDVNGNGVLDNGDHPLQDWLIWLYLPWGGVAWTLTNESGCFEFTGLPYGWYVVVEDSPDGWTHTTPPAYEVLVESGSHIEIPVFLNVHYGKIFGYKFNDLNSNGIWDDGEPPIEGWLIYMIWDEDPTIYVAVTNESGYYEFTNLVPSDTYLVYEQLVGGWTPTNQTWEFVTVESGATVQVHDFGNFQNVILWLFKYNDYFGDGYYDPPDSGIEGWNITVSGPGVPGGSVTVQTDANGYAYVEITAAGVYTVTEEDRDGWSHTTPSTVYVSVISGYAFPWIVEFGNFKCVNITLFKYEDVNSNGVYEPGIDNPIEHWWFYLYGLIVDDWISVETDENGYANLTFCAWDYWYVYEEQRDGWVAVNPDDGFAAFYIVSGHAYNLETGEEQYYYEFGNFQCVQIEVFKYWDTCSNGWYDPQSGDVPREGWWFFLYDADWNLLDWGYTDETGHLTFTVCQAGTYYVVEQDMEGWSHINPANGILTFEIQSGDGPIEAWFGNYEHVRVPIFKYEDMNSNGIYDNGDVAIPGWYFELNRIGGGASYSGYTDINGMLVLEVNRSGLYTLTEEDRAGWVHVNHSSGSVLLSITSGVVVPLQEFGNFHKVEICVFKFDDIYADGYYWPPDGDVPIAGWHFYLYELINDAWVLVDTNVTDDTGHACFEIDHAGLYLVMEENRDGWFWIYPYNGYYVIEVWSGAQYDELWFANFKMGKIYGYKWNDLNGNGEWDQGEPPLAGWTISFETVLGWFYLFGTTTTNETGYYEFTGLPPGLYAVWEDVQDGWTPTSPSLVDVWINGHTEARVDFFNFELVCIDGYKYEDMNGNGVYDNGDQPKEGWNIYLYQTTGVIETPEGPISAIWLVDITQTDENGHYEFCGLGPGIYIVEEELRQGWIPTTPTSEEVNVTSGEDVQIHDFLNFELGSICGWKFNDLNGNGVWDDSEPPIPGWPIYMIRDAQPDIYVTWTNDDGMFCFTDLEADYYIVWEADLYGWTHTTYSAALTVVESGTHVYLDPFGNFLNVSIPIFKYEDVNGNGVYDNGDEGLEGWQFNVTGPGGTQTVYTDVNGWAYVWVTTGGTYTVTEENRTDWTHVNPADGDLQVTVQSGDQLAPLMFGNFRKGSIGGEKFYDWNMNGIRDEGEAGLANWVIWINGTLVGGGWLNFTRLTDSLGQFSVDGLPAGTYIVTERLEYAPAGWVPTTATIYIVTVYSGTAAYVSFGNVVLGEIEGYKFYDKDLDGVLDEDEPGLEGWTVILEGYTDNGDYVYETTITDGSGHYQFVDLQPGVYTVTEVLPATWQNTTELPVTVDVSGAQEEFDVQVNIGNIRFAKIWGYKFLDTYSSTYPFWPNGVFDWFEYGLGNWEITLQGRTTDGDLVNLVTYTDNLFNIGYYKFTGLLPGTYWVNETLLTGYYATRPISNLVIIYPFPLGPVCIRIDFGNLLPTVDPSVNYVLESGWNLWSTALKTKTPLMASSLLHAIGTNGLMVTKLDAVTKIWQSYVTGDPARYDFPIVPGEGYYVYVTGFTSFHLTGTLQLNAQTSVASGWNIVGYNSLEPIMASELLSMVHGSTAVMVTYLDAHTGTYKSYVIGDPARYDFVVTPGRAYFLWVTGPGTIVY